MAGLLIPLGQAAARAAGKVGSKLLKKRKKRKKPEKEPSIADPSKLATSGSQRATKNLSEEAQVEEQKLGKIKLEKRSVETQKLQPILVARQHLVGQTHF